MAGVLRYTLVVRNPETLEATALLAGTQVPGWAAELVHADDLEGAPDDLEGAPESTPTRRR